MPHAKKKQSTGSWKKNRDKHEKTSKTLKEKKRKHDSWFQRPGKKKKGNKKKGFCFITTACVVVKGLSDDCRELTVLRKFRDEFILSLPKGEEIINTYYTFAPEIVKRIVNDPNGISVLEFIYGEIEKSVSFIEQDKPMEALDYYSSMFLKLKKKYIECEEKVYIGL